jgi:hypothetical protein
VLSKCLGKKQVSIEYKREMMLSWLAASRLVLVCRGGVSEGVQRVVSEGVQRWSEGVQRVVSEGVQRVVSEGVQRVVSEGVQRVVSQDGTCVVVVVTCRDVVPSTVTNCAHSGTRVVSTRQKSAATVLWKPHVATLLPLY